MQPKAAKQARPATHSLLRKRNLFIGLFLLIVAFASARVVHGSGTHHVQHHRRASMCALHRRRGTRTCTHTHGRTGGKRSSAKRPSKPRIPAQTPVHRYGAYLVPALDHGRAAFDNIGMTVAATDDSSLDSACSAFEGRVAILTDEADGVPHPGAWYLPVPNLHRQVIGVYHDMASALEVCRTGAENGDGEATATARTDIQNTMESMRRLDDYVHWLARRRP